MIKVLFVCIHNSARSQMAEAYLNHLGMGRFLAQSAGLIPGKLNPLVVDMMNEDGIDISGNATKSVEGFIKNPGSFDYVITVCDEASAERCPIFPGEGKRLHWGFADPSALPGDAQEKRIKTRAIREEIKKKIKDWIPSVTFQNLRS